MKDALPLPTLLSHVLVAFTIEFDNEFERELAGAGRPATFLVSMVMWSNFMRFVDDDGITVRELSARAGVSDNPIHPSLAGMERWGYVVVRPNPADPRPKPPRRDWIVRPTAAGRRARQIWIPLFGEIETRWNERFGGDEIRTLTKTLRALVRRIDLDLPDYLPVVTHAMFVHEGGVASSPDPHLVTLLSQVLHAFTLEFERESDLSLAMSANVMRVLDEKGVRVRDLPRLTGVSKEAISMSMGYLEKRGYVVVEADPTAARTKVVRLTARGRTARDTSRTQLTEVEQRWRERFGADVIGALRASLERLVGSPDWDASPLTRGLVPHVGGWRASVRTPETLPHHPMVLHRGGWPDGS